MSAIKDVTDATFKTEVLGAAGLVLVDFWAPWCKPCRQLDVVIDELADELSDAVTVVRLNTDENPETAERLGITSIPTLLIVRDGEIVKQLVGARPKAVIREAISAHVAA